ncbi:MAG: hypothetical protein GY758_24735, partial [Fuerstiella sp.]|nr:hypothetical protein [Fuerstiella sp.]
MRSVAIFLLCVIPRAAGVRAQEPSASEIYPHLAEQVDHMAFIHSGCAHE